MKNWSTLVELTPSRCNACKFDSIETVSHKGVSSGVRDGTRRDHHQYLRIFRTGVYCGHSELRGLSPFCGLTWYLKDRNYNDMGLPAAQ